MDISHVASIVGVGPHAPLAGVSKMLRGKCTLCLEGSCLTPSIALEFRGRTAKRIGSVRIGKHCLNEYGISSR